MKRRSRLAVVASGVVCLALTGCIQIHLLGRARAPLVESAVRGTTGPKILLLEIDGLILQDEQPGFLGIGRESTVALVREQLDRARDDERVRAILLRIDTPGGGATASDLVYGELMRFKQERGVPVAAHFLGTATSGGYYVAMAADEISAEPTSVTGSIGVIFVGVNVAGLMEKWGIEDQTITAGAHKDAGSYLRRMTPEERGIFQSVIDDLHERFRSVVASGRPGLDPDRIAALADGRIYSAPQALEAGLIDSIGSLEEAVARIEERLGVSESVVVSYHRPNAWRRNLYTRTRGSAGVVPSGASPAMEPVLSRSSMSEVISRLGRPGFQYLWWPGAAGY